MFEPGMNNNIQFDSNVTGNNNIVDNDMNVDINMMNSASMEQGQGMMGGTMSEPVQEKCVHRTIVHEVPQECQFLIDQVR